MQRWDIESSVNENLDDGNRFFVMSRNWWRACHDLSLIHISGAVDECIGVSDGRIGSPLSLQDERRVRRDGLIGLQFTLGPFSKDEGLLVCDSISV